ncbi:MAG TPA: hypothetical protein H9896_05225 [Candidatus Pygmaiobacter gallistercoris]|nr:hypothetical protein [Candidatus Pygmaiobacter gallistercoris]
MTDLETYVDGLFRHQRMTPEVRDLREEILSNMIAKREDLMAQGFDEAAATEKAKESLSSVDSLIDGNQLTCVGSYRAACLQTTLLSCVLFWILSLPLLFFRFGFFSTLGFWLTLIFGLLYLWRIKNPSDAVAFLSISAARRRRTIVWILWGLFFLVCTGVIAAVTFASNLWFGRPVVFTGPYQFAALVMRFYPPLLTILIPITVGSFPKILYKNRKD